MRQSKQEEHFKDYKIHLNHCTMTSPIFVEALSEDEPTSYQESKEYPEQEEAMQDEIDPLDRNETWELIVK